MTVAAATPDELPFGQVLHGDALQVIQMLPEESIDCVVTSPPYFRLRDYGVDGQLGLEATVNTWVVELRAVVNALKRVLVPTGTIWLNLGDTYSTHLSEGAGRKSLLLGPERLALALVEDGWVVRNKIVWAKPNAIPSSVRDRLTTRHETIYLLAKQPHYFFDLDAIREPHTSRKGSPLRRSTGVNPAGATPPPKARPSPRGPARPAWLGPNSDGDAGLRALKARGLVGHPLGKNPGDVWQYATAGYRGAHFATYPEVLIQRILLAGCPEARCTVCRAPWTRRLRRHGRTASRLPLTPTCGCNAGHEPGVVLDPFMGAGTTALAAERLGRQWVGIELNDEYIRLATRRLDADRTRRAGEPTQNQPTRKEVPHD